VMLASKLFKAFLDLVGGSLFAYPQNLII